MPNSAPRKVDKGGALGAMARVRLQAATQAGVPDVLRLLPMIVFNPRVPGLARGSIPGATPAALLTAQTVGPSQGDACFVDRLVDTRHGLGIVRNRPIPSDPELIRPPNPVE